MSYYPILRPHPQRIYYPFGNHVHAELAAIHHDYLIRDQAQLEYLHRTNKFQDIYSANAYSSEVRDKQLRIAMMLENRRRVDDQIDVLRFRSLEQELRKQQIMKRIDLQRAIIGRNSEHSSLTKHYLTDRKDMHKQIHKYSQIDKTKVIDSQHRSSDKVYRGNNKENLKQMLGGQVLNFKPISQKDMFSTKKVENKQESSYDRSRKIKSYFKDISYAEDDQNAIKDLSPHRRSSILKKSAFQNTGRKQVKFIDTTFRQAKTRNSLPKKSRVKQQDSYCLDNSMIKQAHQNKTQLISQSANKKIQNRLKLSGVIYRDSQFKNIKHEVNHLMNTYETQTKIRKEVKRKINTNDKVIEKYNIVVQQI